MIKWKSNYKQKTLEVSASDEFSKRAEILTKKVRYRKATHNKYTLSQHTNSANK